MSDHPPPIYSQQDPVDGTGQQSCPDPTAEFQILIIPAADTVNFQKGYLGADGERATLEGEVQVKGMDPNRWARVTISLRTVESAYESEAVLAFFERELYSKRLGTGPLPSTFPFALPLLPDTPQSIQTPISQISHTLTATFHPVDPLITPCRTKSQVVHTRRYTSHADVPSGPPITHSLHNPTPVHAQVARSVFAAGEAVPVYVTVPPPAIEVVVDQGLRLRNVRAELVRVFKVKHGFQDGGESDSDADAQDSEFDTGCEGSSNRAMSLQSPVPASSSKAPMSPLFSNYSFKSAIARSGASCRFHSRRPIRLRFVLHQPLQPSPESQNESEPIDYDHMHNYADCAMISQQTLLHSVSFYVKVYASFVDTSTHRERISVLRIPITIVGPQAPLPEVSQTIDLAYQKKHDRPPSKTVRYDDLDTAVPQYTAGEAGPSMQGSGAPPPFEERDAPPPFFSSPSEPSTSARLPTFLESEHEIFLPDSDASTIQTIFGANIPGEGVDFGFHAFQQFDGHSEDMQRSSSPPPTLEMATMDTNVTALSDISEPIRAIEALGMVIHQQEEHERDVEPPPPPAMDDPSDPPPSIDSDFRSPEIVRPSSPPHTPPSLRTPTPMPPPQVRTSEFNAPPPYLVPNSHGDQLSVARPPPYVD